jgi:hypothetical protein
VWPGFPRKTFTSPTAVSSTLRSSATRSFADFSALRSAGGKKAFENGAVVGDRGPHALQAAMAEHAGILQALEAHGGKLARERMIAHISVQEFSLQQVFQLVTDRLPVQRP